MRGVVGPPAVAAGPPDALRAARLFLEESVGRIPGLSTSWGRGSALGSLPGRDRPARGLVRVLGRDLGSLPGRGGPARGQAHVRGCCLAIAEDRDQLRLLPCEFGVVSDLRAFYSFRFG